MKPIKNTLVVKYRDLDQTQPHSFRNAQYMTVAEIELANTLLETFGGIRLPDSMSRIALAVKNVTVDGKKLGRGIVGLNGDKLRLYNIFSLKPAHDWHVLGKYYGFPDCCIQAFLNGEHHDGSNREHHFPNSGYIPCLKCDTERTESELLAMINANRHCPTPFTGLNENPDLWINELAFYAFEYDHPGELPDRRDEIKARIRANRGLS